MPNGDKGDATRHEEAALPPSLDDAGEAEEAGQQPQERDDDRSPERENDQLPGREDVNLAMQLV